MHCLRGAGGVFDTACRWDKGGLPQGDKNLTQTLVQGTPSLEPAANVILSTKGESDERESIQREMDGVQR